MDGEVLSENSYAFDAESSVEMARLIDLDRFTTKAMGGPFAGVPDLPEEANVLDLGCGPGSWVLDVAFERPDIEAAGVDISTIMIEYANARARTQKLANACFGVMDITQPLDFSDQTFDLVNARFLTLALPRATWEPLLAECTRILKPGGTLRLTEHVDPAGATTSRAYEHLSRLLYQALWRAGYAFSVDGHNLGMTTVLPRMLRKAGYQNVRCLAHTLEFSADTEAWQDFYGNTRAGSSVMPPFLVKAGVATQEEIEHLFQQTFIEMLSPEFCAMWHFVTTLGTKP